MNENLQTKDVIREFQDDPIKEAFNSLLVRVYSNAIPTTILSGAVPRDYDFKEKQPFFILPHGVTVTQVYDQKVQTLIDKIIKCRDEYLSSRYGWK